MKMITKQGIDLIKQFEKCSLKSYCATEQEEREGKYTIGYGHVLVGGEEDTLGHQIGVTRKWTEITKADAEVLLAKDIESICDRLRKILPEEFLSAQQKDAVVSLIYNIGMANFTKSKVYEHLANKDYERAAYFFRSFTRQGGVRLLGLVRRRAVEKLYFQKGANTYKDVWSGKLDPHEILDLPKTQD
jgi:lysozyme